MEPVLISLQGVSRVYNGGRIAALEGIDLEIRNGEWLTLLGPSGSGKSTLLNILCGLDQPTSGEVLFQGHKPRDANAWATLRARHIGFVFQSFNLLPTFTALENVQMPMFGLVQDRRERLARASELLRQVGLSHRGGHLPGELSGGERQRVAIARSLVNEPNLLLADEPTGNLDSRSAAEIMALLLEIHTRRHAAVVLVTHNSVLTAVGDRWLHLHDGKILKVGTTQDGPPCIS